MKTCVDCGFHLVLKREWEAATPEAREDMRAEGIRRHEGRGLCPACWFRAKRRAQPKPVRPLARVEIVAEEWSMLADRDRSQAANIRLLAPRMGMTESALEKAILRAKKRGLLERAA